MGSLYKRGGTTGNWTAEWTDHTGKVQRKSTRTANKKMAERILRNWEEESIQRKAGLIDVDKERLRDQGQRLLSDHWKEFETAQKAESGDTLHIRSAGDRWQVIVAETGWKFLADIQPEDMQSFLVKFKKSGRYENSKRRSAATGNRYLQTAKGFLNWCVDTNRIPRNPLRSVSPAETETDRRIIRRFLLPEEWAFMRKTILAEDRTFLGTPAECRALLYETAIQSGFRARELRDLQISHFELKKTPFHISARKTKNKKLAKQYITADLAKKLKSFCAGRRGSEQMFQPLCHNSNMADMIRRDAEFAREAWLDEKPKLREERELTDFLSPTNFNGEQLDFHALRHTTGSWLSLKGVHPKKVQEIMRHSTIKLTFDTYGHLMPSGTEGAVEEMSSFLAGNSET